MNLTPFEHEGKFVVDSREVAEMTKTRHDNLVAKIDGYIKVLSNDLNFKVVDFFIESTYQDAKGETRKCYLLSRKGCDMTANKMTGKKGILFTATYVTRFEEMEKQIQQPKLPQTYKEALLALVVAEEEKERLEAEKKELESEVEHKQDVIIGLVDEIDLASKRQILNRVVRKVPNYRERWSELYKQFDLKYRMNVKQRTESYNKKHSSKLITLDYIDKVMNKLPELYEIACKLYENDVKSLVEEMYNLNNPDLPVVI